MKTLLSSVKSFTILCIVNFGFYSLWAQPGSLDTTFGTTGKVTTSMGPGADKIYALALQPDGKIVAGGIQNITGIDNDFALARYNPDGSLDTTFGTGGKVTTPIGNGDDQLKAILIQSDGKIVASGPTDSDPTTSVIFDAALVRYNTDGSLDTSFGTAGIVTSRFGPPGYLFVVNAIGIQSDNKLVVAGIYNGGANGNEFFAIRYTSTGALDNSFGSGGVVFTSFGTSSDTCYGMTIQPDGKIVLCGTAIVPGLQPDFALARYNTDGSLDTTFGTGGLVTTDFGNGYSENGNKVTIQPDGKLILAGFIYGTSTDYALARYNPDGSLDTAFGTGGKVTTGIGTLQDYGASVLLQTDNKIIVSGYSSIALYDFSMARYNTDGTLDTSFGTGGKVNTDFNSGSDDYAYASALQPDGKIILAGASWNDFAIARYNGTVPLNVTTENINQVVVFINPETHIVTIQNSEPSVGKIILYNTLGQEVLQIQNESLMHLSFDTSIYSKGIYVLKIERESGNFIKKILIQ